MHSSGIPASPNISIQRERGSASARAASGDLYRSAGSEGPTSARGARMEAMGEPYRLPSNGSAGVQQLPSPAKGTAGGAPLYGSQRVVSGGEAGPGESEADIQSGLRTSGERFALIFSQLDQLSMNSGLGDRESSKSSSTPSAPPSAGSAAVEVDKDGLSGTGPSAASASSDRQVLQKSPSSSKRALVKSPSSSKRSSAEEPEKQQESP
jgi:hypothetical protein